MADIIRLARTPHDEAQLLLPWYVNGTLDPDAAAMVESHLAACADCRREAEAERILCRDVAELPVAAEQDWVAPSTRPDRRPVHTAPFAFLRRRVSLGWALTGQLATAAALVLALLTPSALQPPPDAPYRALGSPVEHPAGNAIIVFDPAQSEGYMRAALLRVNAQIVDGPNASGAYVLNVPRAKRGEALAQLRSLPNVVLAEPIDRSDQP